MSLPAMLFAAGLGSRMAPLTDTMPKPLVQVAGKPLFDHAFGIVHTADCSPVVTNVHYCGDMIRAHVKERDILISDETDLLRDTGGGLKLARPLLGSGPVVTMNTDAVWNGPNPVQHVLDAWHPEMHALLLLVAKPNVRGHLGKGDFTRATDGRLQRGPALIYTGLQIIRSELVDQIEKDVFSMNLIWDQLIASGTVSGVVYPGQWCDVGQPSSIPLAEEMLRV